MGSSSDQSCVIGDWWSWRKLGQRRMALSGGAAPPPPSSSFVDVDITIVSAKHLKNVNWRLGDLKPYAVVYLAGFDADDHRRLVTKPDNAGSTRPVWNERFTLPVPSLLLDTCTLAVDVFHSKPSETPKPLVGTARCPLRDLIASPHPAAPIRTLELRRPSGRPQGKIRIKVSTLEPAPLPPPSWYLHPLPSRIAMNEQHPPPYQYAGYFSDPHFGCCPLGGCHAPAPIPGPFGGGPSAPVDDQSSRQHLRSNSEGSVVAGLGGLALHEGEVSRELLRRDYGGFKDEYR